MIKTWIILLENVGDDNDDDGTLDKVEFLVHIE